MLSHGRHIIWKVPALLIPESTERSSVPISALNNFTFPLSAMFFKQNWGTVCELQNGNFCPHIKHVSCLACIFACFINCPSIFLVSISWSFAKSSVFISINHIGILPYYDSPFSTTSDLYVCYVQYTTFPTEKQELTTKNNRRAIQALLLFFSFLKTNLPYYLDVCRSIFFLVVSSSANWEW